jgi:hypothetical protein
MCEPLSAWAPPIVKEKHARRKGGKGGKAKEKGEEDIGSAA